MVRDDGDDDGDDGMAAALHHTASVEGGGTVCRRTARTRTAAALRGFERGLCCVADALPSFLPSSLPSASDHEQDPDAVLGEASSHSATSVLDRRVHAAPERETR